MSKKKNFVYDNIEYIENDIDKIKMKTGMYISWVGRKGALHLAKELIQNAVDESANPNSPAAKLRILLDLLEDSLTVEDDGRGIYEDKYPLDIVCTRLQSGSKFTREQGGNSAGENGVGLTATNALSSYFSLASYIDGEMHKIEFENGVKTKDTRKKSSKKHGCIVKFIPSQKYLGKTASIPRKELIEWISKISYFIPKKTKITLDVVKGLEKIETIKFKAKPLSELLLSYVTDEKLTKDVSIHGATKMQEEVTELNGKKKKLDRTLSIDFSFVYNNSLEPYVDSYCNYINTVSGGVHLNAVRDSLWRFFTKRLSESMSDREKEKYKILKVDVEQGLNLVVNLSTDMQMQLVGQTKNEVGNDELMEPIKKLAMDGIIAYFDSNKGELDAILKVIKMNCKARTDAAKIKATAIKVNHNDLDKFMDRKFTPCNNKGNQYKELHLVEGGSAARSIIEARNPDYQAVLEFRGVTANALKRNEATILENAEWAKYVEKLGTNWGPKYNPDKCYYDKIIIETDSDIDGMGITTGICTFHVTFMPEIIQAGRLYKSVAPLYRLNDKNHEFARSKKEFVEVYQDKIVNSYKVAFLENSKNFVSKNEFREFIYDTQDYASKLVRIAKHYGVNKFLVERLAAYLVWNQDYGDHLEDLFGEKKYAETMEWIQKMFPEMKSNGTSTLRGIIEGKFQSVKLNSRFFKKVKELFPVFEKYGYALRIHEKKVSEDRTVSIGQFLDETSKYRPEIMSRFKGLGEANAEQLWDTTLNPDTRILIQFTMDDYEKTLKEFRILRGQTTRDIQLRKEMMRDFVIDRDDLDN